MWLGAFLLLFFLLFLGVPVGISLFLVGGIGLMILRGWSGMIGMFGNLPVSTIAEYLLTIVPMFLFVGFLASSTGLGRDTYTCAHNWLSRFRGGLALTSLGAGALFGAVTGSTTAACVAIGSVSIPEMRKRHYDIRLACGTVSAGACVAGMIPPSITLPLYGIFTSTSIGKLLMAGVLPGILSVVMFGLFVLMMVWIKPGLAPTGTSTSWKDRFTSLKLIIPIVLVFTIIMGGIYSGVFTPAEAAAVAALTMLGIHIWRMGKNAWKPVVGALEGTVRATAMVYFILMGAYIFALFMAQSGMTSTLVNSIGNLNLPKTVILVGLLSIYLPLGCFVDLISSMLISLPLIFPILTALGYNPILLGVLVAKMIEIGLMTPPVGINVFAIRSITPDVSIWTIFNGACWFIGIDLATVAILIAFPQISLWLPSLI
ncbi:TRAP transporter large permease [Chloroflexota bacterium]